jgi:hypothetical protein
MSDYQRDWEQYKRRRNQAWLVFASYVPVCFTAAFISEKLFHTFLPASSSILLDGSFSIYGNPREYVAVPSLRKVVFSDLVVQPWLPSEAMCSLWLTQV